MEIKENFKALDGKMIDLECKFLRFQLQETVFRGSNGSLSGHCRPFITKVQKSYDRFKMMKPARLVQSSRRDPILYYGEPQASLVLKCGSRREL